MWKVSILCAGVMIYGVTKSSVVIVSAVFLPLIAVCLGHAYRTWTVNDFELVVWPRKADEIAKQNQNASDLTTAFKMIEDMFGDDTVMEIENLESGQGT